MGSGSLPDPAWLLLGFIAIVVVALPLIVALSTRSAPRRRPDPVWWSVLGLAQITAVVAAPSFYDHYTGFAAPTLCLLAGYCVFAVREHLTGITRRRIVGVGVAVAPAILAAATMRVASGGHAQPAGLAAAVNGHRCVWFHSSAALIETDRSREQIARDCPMFVDRYAAQVDAVPVADEQISAALAAAIDYQRQLVDQLRGSDAIVINDRQLAELAPTTVAVLHEESTPLEILDDVQIWTRVDS